VVRSPAQKAVITAAPWSALPVPAAVTTKAHSQPHGRNPDRRPTTPARTTGGLSLTRENPRRIMAAMRPVPELCLKIRTPRGGDALESSQRAGNVQRSPDRSRRQPEDRIGQQPAARVRGVAQQATRTARPVRARVESYERPAHPNAVQAPHQTRDENS